MSMCWPVPGAVTDWVGGGGVGSFACGAGGLLAGGLGGVGGAGGLTAVTLMRNLS